MVKFKIVNIVYNIFQNTVIFIKFTLLVLGMNIIKVLLKPLDKMVHIISLMIFLI